MGVLNIWKSIQHNEDVACERTETEKVRQRGAKNKGTKRRDKEWLKIKEGQEISKMLGNLTKKGGQQCPQHIKMSLQVAEKKLTKGRPHRSSIKNGRNYVNISLAQRSVG